MDTLNGKQIKDKISGCWEGKNMGGVLGAPFEMTRELINIDFYTQDLSKGIPANDDLDLQLIWLNACEKYGASVNADILAEYWLAYETGNCSEYGIAKQNLRYGLRPPLSGVVGNHFKNSNGAFIRSEIWACLNPGNPNAAVRLAYEDAIVDHACEGVYAEAFCAAFESAAFFEDDIEKLVEIGLSYVPENSAVYGAVELVKKMYKDGKSVEEIREKLLTVYPSYFGIFNKHPWEVKEKFPLGELGFDAPVQIGIIVAALLFGKGDFERTVLTAVHCGEDADCTAATVGAMIGIIKGDSGLPEKWKKPLGKKIETLFINRTMALNVPEDTDNLTERVMRLLPIFNDNAHCSIGDDGLVLKPDSMQIYDSRDLYFAGNYGIEEMKIHDLLTLAPYKKLYKNPIFHAIVDYGKEPFVKLGERVKIGLTLINQNLEHTKYCICVKVMADEGTEINTGKYMRAMVANNYLTKSEMEIEFTVNEQHSPYVDIYLDITVEGKSTNEVIKCRYFFK